VAKNTGTPEGNTRNQCPMCRAPMCEPIEPSAHTSALIENYKNLWERKSEEHRNMIVQSTAHQKMFVSVIQQKSVQVSQLERALQRNEDEVERLNFVLKRRDERIVENTNENQQLTVMIKKFSLKFSSAASTVIQRVWRGHSARKPYGAIDIVRVNIIVLSNERRRYRWHILRRYEQCQAQWGAVGIHNKTVWKLLQKSAARKIQRAWRRPFPASPERDVPYHDALFRAELEADFEYSDMDTAEDWNE